MSSERYVPERQVSTHAVAVAPRHRVVRCSRCGETIPAGMVYNLVRLSGVVPNGDYHRGCFLEVRRGRKEA